MQVRGGIASDAETLLPTTDETRWLMHIQFT